MRAASTAVSPPPTTTTRRPSRGGSSSATRWRSDRASSTAARVAGGDVDPPGQLRPDGQEHGVVPSRVALGAHVEHRPAQLDLDAEGQDPVDLGVQHVAGQPIGGDPVPQHPAGSVGPVHQVDGMAPATQVVGRAQPGRARAHHQDPAAGRRPGRRQGPPLLEGEVTEEPFDRVDAHRLVELGPVARRLARVEADPPHHRRQRVGRHQQLPRRPVVPRLGVVQPALDVLAGRARPAARWHRGGRRRGVRTATSRSGWRGSTRHRG